MWLRLARSDQLPPIEDWAVWLQMGGRGAGKTRAGAEWIRGLINSGVRRVALVGPTYQSAREVMIEGESGLCNIGYRSERPKFIAYRQRLEWPNGAVGYVFSGEDPDGLRGPQFEAAWADEFCAWERPAETLSNLRMGVRLGAAPRVAMTTTPRNIKPLRDVIKTQGTHVTTSSTLINRHHLAAQFITAIEAAYGGTQLARQELGGELLSDAENALWTYGLLEDCRAERPARFDKIIVAVDPAVTAHAGSDATGIIVAGCIEEDAGNIAYILHDATVQGVNPARWAEAVAACCYTFKADYIVAETNQGGGLVKTVISAVDSGLVVQPVFAKVSKERRATPVSILYAQGRVKHAGDFPELEDELCSFGVMKYQSPDRADALVWAVADLLLSGQAQPNIRQL